MTRTGRILIVDDDQAFRRTTARMLSNHGYECMEADSSAAANSLLNADSGIHVLLCDIRMPGGSGMDLLRRVAVDFPDIAVVMTTGMDDPATAELAFEIGAFGYMVKPCLTNDLLISLAGVLQRRDEAIARRNHKIEPTQRGVDAALRPREREVLALMASGLSNRQIAERLSLSLNTVRNHVQGTLSKLDAHSKLEAVAAGVREGIIEYPIEIVDP